MHEAGRPARTEQGGTPGNVLGANLVRLEGAHGTKTLLETTLSDPPRSCGHPPELAYKRERKQTKLQRVLQDLRGLLATNNEIGGRRKACSKTRAAN